MRFVLDSHRPDLFDRARRVAWVYAEGRVAANTVGVVILGAVARGYFDEDADIDVAIFEDTGSSETAISTQTVEGFEVQTFVSAYRHSRDTNWDMAKRWAFSTSLVVFQRDQAMDSLLAEKVALGTDERVALMKTGITLSEWYCHRLPQLWVRRNDLLSAHHGFAEGLNHFLTALYALNHELVPDHKWRVYGLRSLTRVPGDLTSRLSRVMEVREPSADDVVRRIQAFLSLWSETLPWIEEAVGMPYDAFRDTI